MNYRLNESCVISEINSARSQPNQYSKKIEKLLKNFNENFFIFPNKTDRLLTLEGVNGFKESINFLNSQTTLNKLEQDLNLSKAAEAIAEQFSRTRDMNSINQTNIHDIINRYGTSQGNIGISIDFGNDNAEMLVISLITDDGRKERKNRKLMFNYNYNKIGCSSKISKFHRNVTVILYANDFFDKNKFNKNKINYVNENVEGLDPKIDLFTDSAKMVDNKYYVKRNNYSETGNDCYNYAYPGGNVYKINKNDPDMKNVKKMEKNERFIFENGKKVKIVMIKKYMDNGEINTTVEKFNL